MITIFLIATNRYVEFVPELLDSIAENFCSDSQVQVVLMTDNPKIQGLRSSSAQLDITIVEIKSYIWPEATLLRFRLIQENWNLVKGEVVMYMDVDTKVVNPISKTNLMDALGSKMMAVVSHPGYFNRNILIRYILKLSIFIGWEKRKKSTAFTPFNLRQTYVCGGVWFGRYDYLHSIISTLALNVDKDISSGIIAKFHDESHLNRMFAIHNEDFVVLTPSWAYDYTYSNLRNIHPLIEVIRKPMEFNAVK